MQNKNGKDRSKNRLTGRSPLRGQKSAMVHTGGKGGGGGRSGHHLHTTYTNDARANRSKENPKKFSALP
jgi:hypothetical protein